LLRTIQVRKKLQPTVVTETVMYDTDDPAIWINPEDPLKASSSEQIRIRMADCMLSI
jgi:myo-inositol-hexaphosphate 3-phosphohydrolase